jgi:hypothetical protein
MRSHQHQPIPRATEHSVVAEGTRAGAVAASGVAIGYLTADALIGRPFVTPELLGRGVATVLGVGEAASTATIVAGYTLLHFAAFAAFGIVAAAVLRVARRDASVLAGALLVFAMMEVAFAALVAALHATTATGTFTWIQLVGGNVVGILLLALALRRGRPELRRGLDAAMQGTGAWAVR